MSDTITVQASEHVLEIGLNRAPKRNAFTVEMLRALAEALRTYEQDPSLRCAVLFAHGEHFTAGLDLAEVGPAVASGAPLFPEDAPDPLGLGPIRRSKPLVCAVQGWCLTIGIELLLASDIRVAATDTRFGQIEVKRGIMPFGGATLRLPQVAGWGNAQRWLLTGDTFDAQEAFRIGLVQELCAPGESQALARSIAERVAAQAPLAVQASLRSSRMAIEVGFEAAAAALLAEARRLMTTDDAREGVHSFLERRDAHFKGS